MEDADANGEDDVDSGSGEGSGDVGKILFIVEKSTYFLLLNMLRYMECNFSRPA